MVLGKIAHLAKQLLVHVHGSQTSQAALSDAVEHATRIHVAACPLQKAMRKLVGWRLNDERHQQKNACSDVLAAQGMSARYFGFSCYPVQAILTQAWQE